MKERNSASNSCLIYVFTEYNFKVQARIRQLDVVVIIGAGAAAVVSASVVVDDFFYRFVFILRYCKCEQHRPSSLNYTCEQKRSTTQTHLVHTPIP